MKLVRGISTIKRVNKVHLALFGNFICKGGSHLLQ